MMSIKSIMTTDVRTVSETTPIYAAIDLLTKYKVSGMPVINSQSQIVGILSEKDVLKLLIDKNLNVHNTVADYMTCDVITFHEHDDAIEICRFFLNTHIRRVPIVNDGKLVGIVSRRDIVSLIIEAKSKISEFRYV